MTVEAYEPEAYNIGFEVGDPIAPSVEEYSEYPEDWRDARRYENRDMVAEVVHATGWLEWARREMDIGSKPYSVANENLLEAQDIEASNDTQFHVTLEGYQAEPHTLYHAPQTYHIAQIGDPLENADFLEKAVARGYSPAEIADLFGPLSAQETEERLEFLGLIEDNTLEVSGETVDLKTFHDDPWKDPRLLEKFDSAGYSIGEVAHELGVSSEKVTKQVKAYNLDA